MDGIDWNPVLMALIALVSVTLAPLVTLYVGSKIKQSTDRVAEAAATQSQEIKEVRALVNGSKTAIEEKLELVTEKLGISEVDKATLAQQVKGDEQRRDREARTALEEKVRVAEAAVPPAPVVGTPTEAPVEPALGTAAHPIPIVLQAEQVDADAKVINVSKEGPQTDGG